MTQPPRPDIEMTLTLAVITSSTSPVLILDGDCKVIAASASFCRAFQIDPATVPGQQIYALGDGEWNEPRLRSLLSSTVDAGVSVDAYEMDLKSVRQGTRRVVLNAHRLDYADKQNVRLLLACSDVTDLRIADKVKDALVRDKELLIREVQHRVANSLQIIASLIMQSARKVQSDEMRGHLHAAHDRVISIAAVQQQLAVSQNDTVNVRFYFTQLCRSLSASMIGDHTQLSIVVHADESTVDGDASVSLGLIVTELVINAIKHAFPAERRGKISVSYQSHGPDWTLSVHDNGVGMPVHPAMAQPGLGTSIIEAIARQLNARIDVAETHPGTAISVVYQHMAASDRGANIIKLSRSV